MELFKNIDPESLTIVSKAYIGCEVSEYSITQCETVLLILLSYGSKIQSDKIEHIGELL